MIGLIEWIILFIISFHLAYSHPEKILKHALVFLILCLSAIPIDYLFGILIHIPFLPTTLQESFAINLACFGIMNIGLGLGGIIRTLKSTRMKRGNKL